MRSHSSKQLSRLFGALLLMGVSLVGCSKEDTGPTPAPNSSGRAPSSSGSPMGGPTDGKKKKIVFITKETTWHTTRFSVQKNCSFVRLG